MSFFGEIERWVAELYPYRWPITAALIAAVAGIAFLAYRRGWHLAAWRHKMLTGVVTLALLAAAIPAGDYFLSPLWERSFLEEESPLLEAAGGSPAEPGRETDIPASEASPAASTGSDGAAGVGTSGADDATPPAFTPRSILSGQFEGADDFHFGRGQAIIIETAPGVYTLRFEDFSVRNGPDLFVYLSPDRDGYADGSLELGRLKATDGAFNYEIPPGTDITRFSSAVVWCKPFGVQFAAATLLSE